MKISLFSVSVFEFVNIVLRVPEKNLSENYSENWGENRVKKMAVVFNAFLRGKSSMFVFRAGFTTVFTQGFSMRSTAPLGGFHSGFDSGFH